MILGFCFTMVLDHYFMSFLPFPWLINYNHASWGIKSFTYSSPSCFLSKKNYFPWIHGVVHDYVLQASSHTNERRITSGVIPRFYIDPTPLWWRSQTTRSAPPSRSQTPSSLVLLNFFELLYFGDFIVRWPHFWWWTWNYQWRFLWNWRHLNFCMVFNSRR